MRKKEALGGRCVTFGSEQKIDGLPGGVHRSIQIPVFSFHFDIGFIDTVGAIRGLEKRPAAGCQLGAIALDPAKDTGVIDGPALLAQHPFQLPIAQRKAQIPPHTQ